MSWQIFLVNGLGGLIGYLLGSISFAVIFSKIKHHKDIRKLGSGNAGATNTARNFGFKEGLAVFFLDFAKVVAAVVITWRLKESGAFRDSGKIIVQISGFMAFVGHLYPLWFGFKGGKGVSTFFGFLVSFNIIVAIIYVLIMMFIAFRWKMVSLASVISPAIIFCLSWIPWFQTGILTFFFRDNAWWLTSFFIFVMAGIIVLVHIPNIKRILAEEESSINQILKK